MEPIVIIVGKDEKITKEMLEKYVKEAYEKGYDKGKSEGCGYVPIYYDRCYNCPYKHNWTPSITWTAGTGTDWCISGSNISTTTATGVEL
jgi:hypothetical protein